MSSVYVLDACALLAVLSREDGAEGCRYKMLVFTKFDSYDMLM